MGTFYSPPNIAQPDFALPNRKPTGPVEIDWSNPVNRKLAFFGIVTRAGLLDLVTQGVYPLPNATIQPFDATTGLVAIYDGVNSDTITLSQPIALDNPGNRTKLTQAAHLVAYENQEIVTSRIFKWYNSSSNDWFSFNRPYNGSRTGGIVVTFGSETATPAESIGYKTPAVVGATQDGSDDVRQIIYHHGLEVHDETDSTSTASIGTEIDQIRVGDPAEDGLAAIALWKDTLYGPAIHREMGRNFYGGLKPAVPDQVFVPAAAAGGATLHQAQNKSFNTGLAGGFVR